MLVNFDSINIVKFNNVVSVICNRETGYPTRPRRHSRQAAARDGKL
jgi:hypothetical protein